MSAADAHNKTKHLSSGQICKHRRCNTVKSSQLNDRRSATATKKLSGEANVRILVLYDLYYIISISSSQHTHLTNVNNIEARTAEENTKKMESKMANARARFAAAVDWRAERDERKNGGAFFVCHL